ncbi:MAG: ATP synthase F1 subunit gamma, partial [Alphaproteobacteria bacterium]|nr:ATP synthase F1 subunit gamma [Alphaproteobacteria bacterium]
MANLKDLRVRISSVKSTQRITSAMKMVAAAKLRRAQEDAEATRPYAERMERMLGSLALSAVTAGTAPPLLAGSGKDDVHLLIVMTTDRGLCGGFNGSVGRSTRKRILELRADGKEVKLLIVGRKGRGILRREFGDIIIDTLEDTARPSPRFQTGAEIAQRARDMFEAGECDVCTIVYNKFVSALTQEVTAQQLIPFALPEVEGDSNDGTEERASALNSGAVYEYEPDEQEILADLLPRNLSVQVFRTMIES